MNTQLLSPQTLAWLRDHMVIGGERIFERMEANARQAKSGLKPQERVS